MAKFSESISKNFSSRGSSAILAIALYKKIKSDVIKVSNLKFLFKFLSSPDIIKENNFSSIKDMGKLMNIIKSNYLGEIDMGVAGKIAKDSLGK